MEKSSITSNYNFSRIKQNSDDVDCFRENTRQPIYNFYCIYCKRNAIRAIILPKYYKFSTTREFCLIAGVFMRRRKHNMAAQTFVAFVSCYLSGQHSSTITSFPWKTGCFKIFIRLLPTNEHRAVFVIQRIKEDNKKWLRYFRRYKCQI